MRFYSAALIPLFAFSLLSACGDSLADIHYKGDALATIRGELHIEATNRPNDTLQVTLVWAVEDLIDFRVNEDIALEGDSFGRYEIEMLVPPPDAALNVDPETGGRIGFANIFAYDDPNGDGPINLGNIEAENYATLLFRMRGGAPNIMLGYAKDSFDVGTNIANELGTALSPGYFLVRFDGDCYCPFSNDPCQDSNGQTCDVRLDMTVLPLDTDVDLSLVNDISDFEAVPTPDWLFF